MSTEKDPAAVGGDVSLSQSVAYFAIQSTSLSLDEISALVGAEPDRGWSIGERFHRPHSGIELVRGFSWWVRDSGAAPGAPIRLHLDALLPFVRSVAGRLTGSPPASPVLNIVQYLYNDDEVGFHLDGEWIALLGSMSASIDVDQYQD